MHLLSFYAFYCSVQKNTGLNIVYCKVWTDIRRSLENSPFFCSEFQKHIPHTFVLCIIDNCTLFYNPIRSTKLSKYIPV